MPWWARVNHAEMIVVSRPPPVPLPANTVATLPINAPSFHNFPVCSRNERIEEVMLPNRVPVPKAIPS